MATQAHQALSPGTWNHDLIWERSLCRNHYIKDLKMERLSWIFLVGPKCDHKCQFQRGGGRVYTHTHRGKGDGGWRQRLQGLASRRGFSLEPPRNKAHQHLPCPLTPVGFLVSVTVRE